MRIGPELSVQARPESDRGVTEPDPSPTQLKSIFFHTNDTFTFVFMKVRLYYATAAHLEMSTNRWAQHLCPIYKMYFNHTIKPLQHVKQAHWLPCIISCFKFQISNRADVTEPDPNPSKISKYLSEPEPARRVPSGTVGLGSGIQSQAVQRPWRMKRHLYPCSDRWFCERSQGLFKYAVNAHLSQLSSSGLT